MPTAKEAASAPQPDAKRRPGLGANPLDILLTPEEPQVEPSRASAVSRKPRPAAPPPAPPAPRKIRSTYHLPEDLVEGLRDAALHLAGPPEYLTLSNLVENALRSELERLRKKRNKGKPFPTRPHELRGGRPIGS